MKRYYRQCPSATTHPTSLRSSALSFRQWADKEGWEGFNVFNALALNYSTINQSLISKNYYLCQLSKKRNE